MKDQQIPTRLGRARAARDSSRRGHLHDRQLERPIVELDRAIEIAQTQPSRGLPRSGLLEAFAGGRLRRGALELDRRCARRMVLGS